MTNRQGNTCTAGEIADTGTCASNPLDQDDVAATLVKDGISSTIKEEEDEHQLLQHIASCAHQPHVRR